MIQRLSHEKKTQESLGKKSFGTPSTDSAKFKSYLVEEKKGPHADTGMVIAPYGFCNQSVACSDQNTNLNGKNSTLSDCDYILSLSPFTKTPSNLPINTLTSISQVDQLQQV